MRALRQGGRLGTHPKSGLKGLVKRLEAGGGPGLLRPLETAGGLGAGNPPKSGVRAWGALGAFRRPLEAPAPEATSKIPADTSKQPGGREAPGWRPLQTRLRRARLSLGRSKKTIFSRWELRA